MNAPVFARPKEKVAFDPNRFAATPLFECPEMKVIRATFQAGQFIPVHMPDVHVVLYILSGEGEVVAGEKRRRVREGDLVVVPRKVARGVKAKTDMVVLHVVSPPAYGGRPRRHGGKNRPGGLRAAGLNFERSFGGGPVWARRGTIHPFFFPSSDQVPRHSRYIDIDQCICGCDE